jgi:hypothetical protein
MNKTQAMHSAVNVIVLGETVRVDKSLQQELSDMLKKSNISYETIEDMENNECVLFKKLS